MAEIKHLPDVRPGQVWADNDKRGYGRKVRVVEIIEAWGDRYAVVEQVTGRRSYDAKPGKRTKIRLDRFRPNSTGYRLVTDVPQEG